jgi:acetyl esterase
MTASTAQQVGQTLAARLLTLPGHLPAAGRRPPEATGLDPEAWAIARLAHLDPRPPLERLPVAQARARSQRDLPFLGVPPRSDVEAAPVAIPGTTGTIPARLYTPAGTNRSTALESGLLVYFHGGGWVLGTLDNFDATCRELSHASGARVLSVDYRLAPEHPFPTAAEDALAAYAWALSQAPAVAVGGDSAGGNLAAVTALAAREAGIARPAFQLLLYPICDVTRESATYTEYRTGYVLTAALMRWFVAHYVPDRERRSDPRVSPLVASDLRDLPATHIVTALADPLRAEGEEYAARLREAGVAAHHRRVPLLHGFASMLASRACRKALVDAARALAQGFDPTEVPTHA